MVVAIPSTLDENDFEDEIIDHIKKFSKRLAKRMSLYLDSEEGECECDTEGIPLQEVRVTFGNLEPQDTATIQALMYQLLNDPEAYIYGSVLDPDAGDENEEIDDDADWWREV
jgi:hypothetical protein